MLTRNGYILSILDGTHIKNEDSFAVVTSSDRGIVRLGKLLPIVHSALSLLSYGTTEQELTNRVLETTDDAIPVAQLLYCLNKLDIAGCLVRGIPGTDGVSIADIQPLSTAWLSTRTNEKIDLDVLRLSRFAYLHWRDDGVAIIDSALGYAQLIIYDSKILILVSRLAGQTPHEALLAVDLDPKSAEALVVALTAVGILAYPENEGKGFHQTWEFHDLLFHTRSRMGRVDGPYGGTYRFGQEGPQSTASGNESFHPLPRQRPGNQGADLTLTEALESRRSTRVFGDHALTTAELGEFLFRVARVKETYEFRGHTYSRRPYPNGGACYELEIYVVSDARGERTKGLYHYCPYLHGLEKVSGDTPEVSRLLMQLDSVIEKNPRSGVLLIIASRFRRTAWKYERMAYALTLKNVGVLYQTMYLVATSMGLAACAIGGGDEQVFCTAAGTASLEESSVGEFALGSSSCSIQSKTPNSAQTSKS